jgi:hypothetical protein
MVCWKSRSVSLLIKEFYLGMCFLLAPSSQTLAQAFFLHALHKALASWSTWKITNLTSDRKFSTKMSSEKYFWIWHFCSMPYIEMLMLHYSMPCILALRKKLSIFIGKTTIHGSTHSVHLWALWSQLSRRKARNEPSFELTKPSTRQELHQQLQHTSAKRKPKTNKKRQYKENATKRPVERALSSVAPEQARPCPRQQTSYAPK